MNTTLLKNSIRLLFWALTLVACNAPADISGRLEGLPQEDARIYLIQPETLREVAASYLGKVIDSAIVQADGSFAFHHLPKTEVPVLLQLAVQPTGKAPNYLQTNDPMRANYMPILWQAGERLQITASFHAFQKSFALEQPSAVNAALLALRDIKAQAYQTHLDEKQGAVTDDGALLAQEHARLQYRTALMSFAKSTPHLMPAMVALRWVSPAHDYERVPEFLVHQCTKWVAKQPDHPWVKELCKAGDPTNLPVLVGDAFPNLKLPLSTKDTLPLNDLLGKKLTIIDLWASWCAPCRKENREVLAPLWDAYHDQGLQIIAYALENDETVWNAAAARDGANRWYQASDVQGDDAPFLKQIRVRTIPANFILDHKGVVLAKNVHGTDIMELVKNHMEKE
jgi:thiol-disulfide isomerase/thioredoxin